MTGRDSAAALGDVVAMPFYVPSGGEVDVCDAALDAGQAVMLVGPTGCGKTRLVEHVAARRGRPLRTIVGNDDTSTADLLGRFLVTGGDVRWADGPVTTAVREGAICYVDEVVEIRREALAVLHPLSDDRRRIHLDRTGEVVYAAAEFGLVCSYNPVRSMGMRELRPAFRQRFVTIALDYLGADEEAAVVVRESAVDEDVAVRLVALATALRVGARPGMDVPSTRSLVVAARLVARGVSEQRAVDHCILAPLVHGGNLSAAGAAEVAAMVAET